MDEKAEIETIIKDKNIEKEEEVNDDEKQRLIKVLEKTKNELEKKKNKTLSDVYLSYSEEDFMKEKEIREKKKNKGCVCFYKLLLFIITTIYLTGSFIIASLKKSYWNLFKSSLACRLDFHCDKEEFKKRANFFEYFHEQMIRQPLDLNLIMFWNFLGIKLSNLIGLRGTSGIFLLVNILILLLTYFIDYNEYDPETCEYSSLKVLLFFFNWVFMAISFGASTLLAQQYFIDYYDLLDNYSNPDEVLQQEIEMNIPIQEDNYNNVKHNDTMDKIEAQNEETKQRNINTLFLLGLSSFSGYLVKYGIAYGFINYKEGIQRTRNETFYNNSRDILNDINKYSFYSNITDYNSSISNYETNQDIFMYMSIIYILCILISVFIINSLMIFCFFQDKKKSDCCKCNCSCNCCIFKIACEICGCLFFFERIILDEKKADIKGYCQLCGESIKNYCDNMICNMLNCKKNIQDLNEKHFNKKTQCFCYCYQEESFCYWINTFCVNKTQKKIFIFMILYLLIRLSSIGCEKKYEDILQNNNIYDEIFPFFYNLLIMLGTLIVIVLVFCFIRHIFEKELLMKFGSNCKGEINNCINRFFILFTVFIILVSTFGASFIYSYTLLFSEFKPTPIIKDLTFIERTNLYGIAFGNAFCLFLLNYYCLILTKNQIGLEVLFSQTILVTIYLIIIEIIIYIIKYFCPNINKLLLLQFIISGILTLVIGIFILRFIFFLCSQRYKQCQYKEGICKCEICFCNNNSLFFCECCNLRCSECNCNYICCESFCLILYDCLANFLRSDDNNEKTK